MIHEKMRTPYGIIPLAHAEWLCRHSVLRWQESTKDYTILKRLVDTNRCREHGYDREKQRLTQGHKCYRAIGDMVISRHVQKSDGSLSPADIVRKFVTGELDFTKYEGLVLSWLAGGTDPIANTLAL